MISTALLGLAGCAGTPRALLDVPTDPVPVDPLVAGIVIDAIEGRAAVSQQLRLPAGEYSLLVRSRLDARTLRQGPKRVTLQVQACQVYTLGAQHRSRFDPRFELLVVRQQPMAGCVVDEGGAQPSSS